MANRLKAGIIALILVFGTCVAMAQQRGSQAGVSLRVYVYLKKTGAQLWIEHDLATAQKLKKAPAYYD